MVVIRGKFPLQHPEKKNNLLGKLIPWLLTVGKQSFQSFVQSVFRAIGIISGTVYTLAFGLGLISLVLVCVLAIIGQMAHKPLDLASWYKLAHFEWVLFPYWACALVVSTACKFSQTPNGNRLKRY